MPLPTHTLTLQITEPDNTTSVDGSWRIWLETVNGIAVDDLGNGMAGSDTYPTTDGLATIALPDTTATGYDPQGAFYKAAFISTDRRVRVKSAPFLMDRNKTFRDILTVANVPVTFSLLEQTMAARDAALAAESAAQGYAAAAAASAAGAGLTSADIDPLNATLVADPASGTRVALDDLYVEQVALPQGIADEIDNVGSPARRTLDAAFAHNDLDGNLVIGTTRLPYVRREFVTQSTYDALTPDPYTDYWIVEG